MQPVLCQYGLKIGSDAQILTASCASLAWMGSSYSVRMSLLISWPADGKAGGGNGSKMVIAEYCRGDRVKYQAVESPIVPPPSTMTDGPVLGFSVAMLSAKNALMQRSPGSGETTESFD